MPTIQFVCYGSTSWPLITQKFIHWQTGQLLVRSLMSRQDFFTECQVSQFCTIIGGFQVEYFSKFVVCFLNPQLQSTILGFPQIMNFLYNLGVHFHYDMGDELQKVFTHSVSQGVDSHHHVHELVHYSDVINFVFKLHYRFKVIFR